MRLRFLPCLIVLGVSSCTLSHNPDLPSFGDGDGDGDGDGGDGDGDGDSGTGGAHPIGGAGGVLGGDGGAH